MSALSSAAIRAMTPSRSLRERALASRVLRCSSLRSPAAILPLPAEPARSASASAARQTPAATGETIAQGASGRPRA